MDEREREREYSILGMHVKLGRTGWKEKER